MRKRTYLDIFISTFNRIRYKAVEPLLLRLNRFLFEKNYLNINENPLVTITIPTYDRGQLLVDRTLPSIYSQTYQNFEIIIVGDCCVDETAQLISSIKHPKVQFVNMSKRTKYPSDPTLRWFISGVGPSNFALNMARGKWICYFDDDDIMAPEYLESLLRFAQQGGYEFVAGLYEEEREGLVSIRGHRTSKEPEFGGHSTWMYRSYLKFFKYDANSWRKSYNCPQDIDLQLRMNDAGVKMGALNKVVSYIRPRPGLNTIGLAARLADTESSADQ